VSALKNISSRDTDLPMDTTALDPRYIELLAKQLPPSGAVLRLLDLAGKAGAGLLERRADIEIVENKGLPNMPENSVDAVLFSAMPDDSLLRHGLRALRPGGRLIGIDPQGGANRDAVDQLETAGFIRILVEPAEPAGVLLRGEKPHETDDTLTRIDVVARQETPRPDMRMFKGRNVYVLARQTPNKPAWALKPGERVRWHAVGVEEGGQIAALAFSSLPNAVAFMQRAVLAGAVRDVNKVAKYSREVAEQWPFMLVINPIFSEMESAIYGEIEVDPATAVTGEE